MAAEIGRNGYIIVSGMALGIDNAAHRGDLSTVAIGGVAGGIDMSYPPENEDLFDQVLATGLLLAEMPPGTHPTPRHFPIRNRVIASLAICVVVADAARRSRSLITTTEAADRGSDVMAVPVSQLNLCSEGGNRLILGGATLVKNAADVIEYISCQTNVEMPPSAPEWTDRVRRFINQTAVDNVRESMLRDCHLTR